MLGFRLGLLLGDAEGGFVMGDELGLFDGSAEGLCELGDMLGLVEGLDVGIIVVGCDDGDRLGPVYDASCEYC